MIIFEREPAFILKRRPYKENAYLVDILSLNHGKLRASAKIRTQKNQRNTQEYAPFSEIEIYGRQKGELASLWKSEIIKQYPLHGKDFLSASYLNELMLQHAPDESAPLLYTLYKNCLKTPKHEQLRHLEWQLIQELGIIPERNKNANYYELIEREHLILKPSTQGFCHTLITALEIGNLPLDHPQLKNYLQNLLAHHKKTTHTQNIYQQFKKILTNNL